MKLIPIIFLIFAGIAQARMSNTEIQGTAKGVVKVETKWTVTCMAIGCPPSRPYTQVSLLNAQVEGYGQFAEIEIQDPSLRDFALNTNTVELAGVQVRSGFKVKLDGTFLVRRYSFDPKVYITVTQVKKVKVVR